MRPDDDTPRDEEYPVDPIVVPIEEAFDLHTFAPREIGDAVRAYLEAAVEAGFREVRVIHGRGKGIQRDRVQRLLAGHPLVLEFSDAPPQRGGWGATLVRLRTPAREPLK
jgi:DNA-nicking Smr family endonuclease